MSDSYSWTAEDPPPSHVHSWTRVYRLNGKVAHIEELLYSAHPFMPWMDDRDGWFGTGSQEEYERAAEMPLCPRCFVGRTQYE